MGLWAMLMGEEPGILNTLLHYENKGQFGEYATNFALTNNNVPGHSKTICNAYLPDKGHTTELDVVMIHEKGIFVFESKNYSGWIFGTAQQQKWTQCLANKEKHQFYNPIKQNQTHCRALAAFLQISLDSIASYIIFSNRCELKSVPADTQYYKIVRREHLLHQLRKELKAKPILYTHSEVDQMAEKILSQANVSVEQKEKHVEQIKERSEGTVCPYCGGKLVLRSGQYGKFYGCASYPKCRYTRKLEY